MPADPPPPAYCRHRKVRCEFTNEEDPYRRCDNCIKLERCECRLRPVNDNEEPDLEGELLDSLSPSPSLDGKAERMSPTSTPLSLPVASPPFGLLNTTFPSSTPPLNQGLTRSNSAASTFSRREDAHDSVSSPASLHGQHASSVPMLPSQKLATWPMNDFSDEMPVLDPNTHGYLSNAFWNDTFGPALPQDLALMSMPEPFYFDPHMASMHPINHPHSSNIWNPSPTADLVAEPGSMTRASSPAPQPANISPADLHPQPAAQVPTRANTTGGITKRASAIPHVPPQWQNNGPATAIPSHGNFNPFEWSWDSKTTA